MDENMDDMDGFSMDEEELFKMFNMMFGFGDDGFDGDGLRMGGDMFDLFVYGWLWRPNGCGIFR